MKWQWPVQLPVRRPTDTGILAVSWHSTGNCRFSITQGSLAQLAERPFGPILFL